MPANGQAHRILIVDDSSANLRLALDTLQPYSYEILTARSGETCLERAHLATPDLILLDVELPGINGFEVCRRLKANPTTAAIPVIFMTVRADTPDKVQGLAAGAVDYLTKPLDPAELLARVQTHLALHDLRERLADLVHERTAALEAEIARQQQLQAEKERLWETVREQNDQLRTLTQLLVESQQQQRQGLVQTLTAEVKHDLTRLAGHLYLAQQALHPPPGELTPQVVAHHLDQAAAILDHLQDQAEQVTTALARAASESQGLLDTPLFKLSTREREILQLLLAGKSTGAMAEILVLSPGTISTYRRRIMQKLGVEDMAGLLKFAFQHKLLEG